MEADRPSPRLTIDHDMWMDSHQFRVVFPALVHEPQGHAKQCESVVYRISHVKPDELNERFHVAVRRGSGNVCPPP
jgi:hypothetical protein